MLVGYDAHTIYRVYLPDEQKIIRIKDLKIVENADVKAESQLASYDAIIASQGDMGGDTAISPLNSPHSSPTSPGIQPTSSSYTKTKSGRRGHSSLDNLSSERARPMYSTKKSGERE